MGGGALRRAGGRAVIPQDSVRHILIPSTGPTHHLAVSGSELHRCRCGQTASSFPQALVCLHPDCTTTQTWQGAHCALCFWAKFGRLAFEQYSAMQAHADKSKSRSQKQTVMEILEWVEIIRNNVHAILSREVDTDSAAAAGFAKLQVHCIPLAQLNSYGAHAPFIFSPGRLLAIQHYIGPEPVHGDRILQPLVQIIQRCLQRICSSHSDMLQGFLVLAHSGLKLAVLRYMAGENQRIRISMWHLLGVPKP